MPQQFPTAGRIVMYMLTEQDAHDINVRRSDSAAYRKKNFRAEAGDPGATGFVAHVGNAAAEGQVYPAMVVRVFSPGSSTVNLQVFLDGSDTYWATSRYEGDHAGAWAWPVRV